MRRELGFLLTLWKTNLLMAMEYRAAFVTQVIGVALNNAGLFVFWLIFFGRFEQVRGWQINDMFILYGIVATSVGLSEFLFGNVMFLSTIIAEGKLDYYLSLPRPVLLHVLASRSSSIGFGDVIYGLISFVLGRHYTLGASLRFVFGVFIALVIFLSFLILVHSLSFWLGNARVLGDQARSAISNFAIHPVSLFGGTARFLLFTVIPAAFIGSVPAEFVKAFSWSGFGQMLLAALVFLILALILFHRGLRRYESGSAIQIQI